MNTECSLLLISLLISCAVLPDVDKNNVKVPVFPGAQGFGVYTAGGRYGRIIEVTNLNDKGPGSLRAALSAKGPRIVIFRVSGTIQLNFPIWIEHPYITVAGQTAPGGGICIKGSPIIIRTHDVVLRYIRSRPGDGKMGAPPHMRDALSIEGGGSKDRPKVYNIVIDHCSFSWALDGNIDIIDWFNPPHDITLQNCIISEALRNSSHPKGNHSTALLISMGTKNISIHHCLLAHNVARNPLIGSGTSVVFANNVIYNWGKTWGGDAIQMSLPLYTHLEIHGPAYIDIINNFFKPGNDGGNICMGISNKEPIGTQLYFNGNIGPYYSLSKNFTGEWKKVGIRDVDDWKKETKDFFSFYNSIENKYKSSAQWNNMFSTYDTADEAYDFVLNNAGAILPERDIIDKRIVDDVRNGTGKIIDSQNEVGGWPELKLTAPPNDKDRDGMPDEWETAHGLNPGNQFDRNEDRNGDGYTNIEEYLNELASAKNVPITKAHQPAATGISKFITRLRGFLN